MVRNRPMAVLVMAILNLVFGGLGLVFVLCAGVGMAVAPVALPGAGTDGAEVWEGLLALNQAVPSLKFYILARMIGWLVLSIVLIVSGIGLLRLRTWARWACVVYGVATILLTLASLVYEFSYSNPAVVKWEQEWEQKDQPAGAGGLAQPDASDSALMNNMQSVVIAALEIAYAVALVVVMFLPHVSAAFFGQGQAARRRRDHNAEFEEN